jgi:hypothetical protein
MKCRFNLHLMDLDFSFWFNFIDGFGKFLHLLFPLFLSFFSGRNLAFCSFTIFQIPLDLYLFFLDYGQTNNLHMSCSDLSGSYQYCNCTNLQNLSYKVMAFENFEVKVLFSDQKNTNVQTTSQITMVFKRIYSIN